MLLPKFSIRQLMYVTAGFCLIAMILGWSVRGDVFAYGLGLAIVGLVVPLAVYQAFYWFALVFSNFHSNTTGGAKLVYIPPTPQKVNRNPSPAAGFVTDPFAAQPPASNEPMVSDSSPDSGPDSANRLNHSSDQEQGGDQ